MTGMLDAHFGRMLQRAVRDESPDCIAFDSIVKTRQATDTLLERSRHHLRILDRTLDPAIYGSDQGLFGIGQLLLGRSGTTVQIPVDGDAPGTLVALHHPLGMPSRLVS